MPGFLGGAADRLAGFFDGAAGCLSGISRGAFSIDDGFFCRLDALFNRLFDGCRRVLCFWNDRLRRLLRIARGRRDWPIGW